MPTLLTASLAMASAAHAVDSRAAIQEILLNAGLAGTAAAVCRAVRKLGEAPILSAVVFASLAYFAVTLSIYAMALISNQPLDARLLHIGYENPRFFNHAQALMLPLIAYASLHSQTKRLRMLALAMMALHFAWIGLDLARASAIAVAAGGVLAWALGARRFALRLLSGAAVGAAVYWLIFQVVPAALSAQWTPSFASAKELTSDHSRAYLWALAWKMVSDHPILGVGPMHFAATLNAKGAHPHNLYLQWAAEFGLPLAILLVTSLLAPVARAVAKLRREPAYSDSLLPASIAAATAGLVDACFSGNFVMPQSQMWLTLVFGLLLARVTTAPPSRPPAHTEAAHPWFARGLALVLVLSQSLLVAETWRQWHNDPPRLREGSHLPALDEKPRPRFWRSGWL
jgi:O-antigen ligase